MADHDLIALWETHCRHEFETRDVDATMATMVDAPYVNHVPTMSGGVGHDQLKRFYKYHFIGGNPADTQLVPISRTVGADQIVDELLFTFTHTSEIDWMLPGIPPTGRRVEIPLVAIVRFQDGKVAHEHIYWDQASVLVQIGKLDPEGLPVAGVETSHKVVDKSKELVKETNSRFYLLARRFWPGPLTIIVPASAQVPLRVTGNTGRLALRQSRSAVAQALIESIGQPLISTSANISGQPTCRSGIDVFGMMDSKVALVLDGGLCIGEGPTTVDITEPYWRVIKAGAISEKEIAACLEQP